MGLHDWQQRGRVERKLQTVSTYPYIFRRHFAPRCRGNNQLVNHFIVNVSGVVVVGYKSEYPFSVNANESEYSKIDESGKISSSVKLVSVWSETPNDFLQCFFWVCKSQIVRVFKNISIPSSQEFFLFFNHKAHSNALRMLDLCVEIHNNYSMSPSWIFKVMGK